MFQVSALTFNPIPVSNDTDFAVQFVDLTRDTLESVYTFEDPSTVVTGVGPENLLPAAAS
jgi:arginyl-tRNA--protein-N-Asp/Glu arginylyltransferase